MSEPSKAGGPGPLTPAVAAAAVFTTLAAIVSIAFVTARGGLQVPVAATSQPPVAITSPGPSPSANAQSPGPQPSASPLSPTGAPSAGPVVSPSPVAPPDPLLALPGCPDRPGCHVYTVRRGDSYTGISDRFGVLLWIMRALNPEVTNERLIVVGQALYLARDPTVRLEPCADGTCHLYVVRSGDTLSEIACRFGLTAARIAAANPGLDPSFIVTGHVIRLPPFIAP